MEPDIKMDKPNTHNTKHGLKLHIGQIIMMYYHFMKIQADGMVDPADLKPPASHFENQLHQFLQAKNSERKSGEHFHKSFRFHHFFLVSKK